MVESFGARLRRRREEQAVTLIAIAEQTKIKVSLLEALERDDVSHWPSGIFRRAFIRAYAHAVGLNPDVVVGEFLELYPDPIEVVATVPLIDADAARVSGGPPTRLRFIVGSAIESLSRLRRGSSLEDPAVEEHARPAPSEHVDARVERVTAPAASEPDLPAVAHSIADPDRIESTNEVAAESPPLSDAARFEPDFLAVANLCTEFGRVENANQIEPLLHEAARILDATGLIVWVWDELAAELRPALAHGYSDKVLAQLPTVRTNADNATAAAFRSAQTCTITGSGHESSALVVPLLTPAGCGGVLAMELPRGGEHSPSVRAVATIFAAQFAQLIGPRPAAVHPQAEMAAPPAKSPRRAFYAR